MEIGKPKYSTVVESGVMPFGKHKGVKLCDIEVQYLEWVQKQDWVNEKFPELKTEIEHDLLRRDAEEAELAKYREEERDLWIEYEHAFHEDVFEND